MQPGLASLSCVPVSGLPPSGATSHFEKVLYADSVVAERANRLVLRSRTARVVVGGLARWLAWVEVALMLGLAARGRRQSAARMLGAVSLVYIATEALGRLWPRARPFTAVSGVRALVPHSQGRSFPSRHLAAGLAMAAIAASTHPQLGGVMTMVAWVLGLSRVAAGLHYPTDLAVGLLLGMCVGHLLRE